MVIIEGWYDKMMKRIILTFCAAVLALTANAQPRAVDLGLSVKWASCNVGANSPEQYGDYFAWGETTTKVDYSWGTYKWCKGAYNKLTKYCPSDKADSWGGSGSPDNRLQLLPEDDVARAKWGGNWRMPTDAEFEELLDNCEKEWITYNGVKGYKFTSKKNGKSIFFPAAGYRQRSDHYLAGFFGNYRSSSLNADNPGDAGFLGSRSGNVGKRSGYRFLGLPVRPVTE